MLVFINDHYMPGTSAVATRDGVLHLEELSGRIKLEVQPDSHLADSIFFETICEGRKM